MKKVEKEMTFLKNKAEEQKAKIMQDGQVQHLETSIRWFRTQASKVPAISDI